MNKVLITADNINASRGILLSMNNVVTAPASTVRVLITKNNGCGKHAKHWSGKEAYAV